MVQKEQQCSQTMLVSILRRGAAIWGLYNTKLMSFSTPYVHYYISTGRRGGIFFQVAVAMHQGMLSPFPSSSEEEKNNFTHASPSLSLFLCRERQRLPFKCRVSDTPPSSSSRENRYPGTHSYFPFFPPPRINRAIREWLLIKGRDPSSLFPPLRAPETEAHKHTRRRRRRREALMWSKVK